jgi:hypothetical protein
MVSAMRSTFCLSFKHQRRREERSIPIVRKLSFAQLLLIVLTISFIAGFCVFVLSGATTNRGTTGSIQSERTLIKNAEKASCSTYGHYGSIETLRTEGLLRFKPVYNSVVYIPGAHCGTIVVGSPSYQSSSN